MSELSTTILAAAAGILGSAWNSGGQAMISILAVPGLLSTTSPVPGHLLAQQWAGVYNSGKVLGPQAAVMTLLGYGYLLYDRNSNTSSRGSSSRQGRGSGAGAGAGYYYLGAMGLSIAIVPFTLIFMNPTNQALLAAAAEGPGRLGSEAVGELLVRWKWLNLVRSLFPLAGSVLGLYGLLDELW